MTYITYLSTSYNKFMAHFSIKKQFASLNVIQTENKMEQKVRKNWVWHNLTKLKYTFLNVNVSWSRREIKVFHLNGFGYKFLISDLYHVNVLVGCISMVKWVKIRSNFYCSWVYQISMWKVIKNRKLYVRVIQCKLRPVFFFDFFFIIYRMENFFDRD